MDDTARTAQELAAELERKIGEYEVTCCIAGMHERAPMTLEMERSTIKALVRRLAALASQAESAPSVEAQADKLREAAIFAKEVLAEIYAKYSVKIGPFASQAQKANVLLGAALKEPQR